MIRSLLLVSLFILNSSHGLAAGIVSASSLGPLTKNTPESTEGRRILKTACDGLNFMLRAAKADCAKALEGSSLFTKSAVEFCVAGGMQNIGSCLAKIENRRLDEPLLAVCRLVSSGDSTTKHSGREDCLEFFAKSQSSFDEAGARFCIKHGLGIFHDSLNCLQGIRDREFDVATLSKECGEKGDAYYGFKPETFNQCLERVIGGSSLRKSVICGPGTSASAGGQNPAADTRGER